MQFLTYVNNLRTLASQIDWLDLDDLASLFKVRLQTAANLTADRVVTFPDASGTVYLQGQTLGSSGNAVQAFAYMPLVTVTATRNILLTDVGCRLDCTNTAAAVLTVPTNATTAIPIGARIELKRRAAGTLAVAGAAGVTLQGDPSGTALSGNQNVQYQATLVKTAIDTWSVEFALPNSGTLPGAWQVSGALTVQGAMSLTGQLNSSGGAVNAKVYSSVASVTASKTLALADGGTTQDCTNTADATITVPPNATVAFPVGSTVIVRRRTARLVTLVRGAGVTFTRDGLPLSTATLGSFTVSSECKLVKTATDTWDLQFTQPRPVRYLFIVAGESNSGGFAAINTLNSAELTANPQVQIWNNTASAYQALQLGTNNLVGHTGFTPDNSFCGIERGLTRDMDRLGLSEVYLLKSGQGGSLAAQWLTADASGYFTTFQTRFLAAKAALEARGFEVRPIMVWWQGLNDAGVTASATWRTTTATVLSQFRALVGQDLPIFIYKLMTNAPQSAARIALNAEIDTLAAADSLLFPVTIPTAAEQQGDGTHYTAQGYTTAWNAFADALIRQFGIHDSSSQGAGRGFTSNRPAFIGRCATGVALPLNTQVTLPFTADYDPDSCLSGGGFRVPSWGGGLYSINFFGCLNLQGAGVYAIVKVNGIDAIGSDVVTFASDVNYTAICHDILLLQPGDLVTVAMSQNNFAGTARTTMVASAFQQPRLSIFRLQA